MDAPPGTRATLAGRYELVELVGFGGMAQVWRAYDRELRREVAVKVLSAHPSDDPSARQRFRREARHVASLSHPNIVPVYDFGVADGRSYLVMAYVDGPSLRDVLTAPLPVEVTAQVAVDVLAALGHAHQHGIVHRDVKPANILVDRTGVALVADFGVARATGDTTELTVAGSFVGTAAYASPEQCSGRTVGRASDLYSLGCVLYRCLTGHAPFEADDVERLVLQQRFADPVPLADLRPEVPAALVAAVERAMSKDPDDRFPDAAAMREVLLPLAGPGLERLVDRWSGTDPGGHRVGTEARDTVGGVGETPARTEPAEPGPTVAPGAGRPSIRGAGRRRGTHGPVVALVSVVVLMAAAGTWWVVAGNSGSAPTIPSGLPAGGTLQPGQSISSPDHTYQLVMQGDGNLVEYLTTTRAPRWETGTSGNFGAYAVIQSDGNFVVYPEGKTSPPPGLPTPALWASGTGGHPGSSVQLPNDGIIEVRADHDGPTLWASRP